MELPGHAKPVPVFIKSKGRVEGFRQDTYALLPEEGFLLPHVHVWVSSKEDLAAYQAAFPKLVICQGPMGLARIDNHILDQYPEGSTIIMMVDGLRGVYELHGEGRRRAACVSHRCAQIHMLCTRILDQCIDPHSFVRI